MKKLHLIRHAKSRWDEPGKGDVDRTLNNRGQKACKIMAQPIWDAGCTFDHVYCSIAMRAQLTIRGLAESLPEKEIQWELDEDLYTFSWNNLLSWIYRLDESLTEVVMIGHNPAMTDLCNSLGDGYINNLPTCGYVQMQFPTDNWQHIAPRSGKLMVILTPKGLKSK